jgi:dsDNA-binding SOS-regulon protein
MILDSSVRSADANRSHALSLFLATERQEVRKSNALKKAYSAAFEHPNPV